MACAVAVSAAPLPATWPTSACRIVSSSRANAPRSASPTRSASSASVTVTLVALRGTRTSTYSTVAVDDVVEVLGEVGRDAYERVGGRAGGAAAHVDAAVADLGDELLEPELGADDGELGVELGLGQLGRHARRARVEREMLGLEAVEPDVARAERDLRHGRSVGRRRVDLVGRHDRDPAVHDDPALHRLRPRRLRHGQAERAVSGGVALAHQRGARATDHQPYAGVAERDERGRVGPRRIGQVAGDEAVQLGDLEQRPVTGISPLPSVQSYRIGRRRASIHSAHWRNLGALDLSPQDSDLLPVCTVRLLRATIRTIRKQLSKD